MVLKCWVSIFGFGVLVASAGEAPTRVERIREVFFHQPEEVLVIAHRGDWRNAPENSVAAIEGAIELGCHGVEIDLRRSKDGHFVLMHDETVDRTTSGHGKVRDLTLKQLRKLHLRNGLGRATEFRIPTLEEALDAAQGKVLLNLDKAGDHLAEIASIVESHGMLDHVILKGTQSSSQVRAALGALSEQVIYMPIVNLDDPEKAARQLDEVIEGLHPPAVECVFRKDGNPLLGRLPEYRNQGVRIWFNSLWPSLNGGRDDDRARDEPDAVYGWMLEQGATMIQTDRPGQLLGWLAEHKPARLPAP
ncbi:glycerophosphoryl diester phosphodiesterase [Haloferula luteola]|uniref:Glycerophosphoryl diester phosphodiesterase n=1 Tax=Haloferula luteola TaxID=595692 RepID=A0A840V5F5_9BACT|nr:glycerophosphodiester phosphodiesterase family protein [Haloferula luteola]MBB5353202.1 glycerophosphoryl diester phosphodiesterase [Haloferula luteola]